MKKANRGIINSISQKGRMTMHGIRLLKLELLFGVIIAMCLNGCASLQTKMMISSTKPLRDSMKVAFNKNSDIELARAAIPAGLLQMDGFIELAPDNRDLLVAAAEGYSGYAFGFVVDDDPDRARDLFFKARNYALRALRQNSAIDAALDMQGLESDNAFKKALQTCDKDDVPAMFFAINSWTQWIKLSLDNPEVLMDLSKCEALMYRVLELDDTFYDGGIHAALGAYYAARSVTLGGQPEKAKAHFEEAFAISHSKFLPFYLLYAQYYAVQIQDRDLFVETLQKIIDAPPNLYPEKNLANAIAKMKAERLLSEVDDYF